MPFVVPQSKKSIKQNRWEFEYDGESFDLPLMKFAPIEAMEAFEAGKEATGLLLVADTDRSRAVLRRLDADQVQSLVEDWQQASGVTAGESQGSLDS